MKPRLALPAIAMLALSMTVAFAVPVDAKQLPPKDACQANPGFWAFRAKFADIVKRRDSAALIALTDPNIATSFGGDGGTAEFIRFWRLDDQDGRDSEIWLYLDEMLVLGCNASADQASMPHMFDSWPADRDVFDTLITKGTGIALRAGPSTTSKLLTRLDWDIITIAHAPSGEAPQYWTKVRTDQGQTGYINNEHLRSAIDYRALFNLVDGKWVMTALIAGD